MLPFLSALIVSACIASPSRPANSFSPYGTAAASGVAPVWAITPLKHGSAHLEAQGDGWYAVKILWIVSPRYKSLVVIDVDGGHFVGGTQQIAGVTKARWRDRSTNMLIRRPGCLTFHVGGPGLSRTTTIRATT
ncbi:MAG TPA: hypothetical protein VH210_04205 [Gaiellaceae bacterium]|nr:hypothetical protein [Gaiellaceae bacterium]